MGLFHRAKLEREVLKVLQNLSADTLSFLSVETEVGGRRVVVVEGFAEEDRQLLK